MPMQALTHRTFSDNSSINGGSVDKSARQIKKALSKISQESIFRLNIAKQLSENSTIDMRSQSQM